jgi:GTPase SAR1 family protein
MGYFLLQKYLLNIAITRINCNGYLMLSLRSPAYVHALDAPLVRLSKRDVLTLRDATQGIFVFGASGCGKTSGVLRVVSKSLLRSGAGGLILCGKSDETKLWLDYAAQTGRSSSVLLFSGEGKERFNFLEYELLRGGTGSGETFNMVALLMRLVEVVDKTQGDSGGAFWRNSCKVMLTHAINAVVTAYGTVNLDSIQKIVATAPTQSTPVADKTWRERSFCWQTITQMQINPQGSVSEADRIMAIRYWMEEHARLDEKTRSNIHASLTALLHPFLTGKMRELFTTSTTIIPEMAHEGGILIIDMSIQTWGESGLLAMQLWKYLFQKAAERRVVNEKTRPIFLFGDEYQLFAHAVDDAEFQSTARSAKVCTVYGYTKSSNFVYGDGEKR